VHPTPLYEILAGLILFGIVWLLRKKIDRTGMMLGLFFLLGSIPRFFVEFIRLNPRYAGLSLSQWVAIGSFLLGAALIWRSFVRPAPVPAAAAERPAKGRRRRKG
jgi:phosphatidylglycerol:prolipoprotein diacylglycerol transferase